MDLNVFLDADQLGVTDIENVIRHYMQLTERDKAVRCVKLYVTHNDVSRKKRALLGKYRTFGVTFVEVPTRKQSADMVLIAQIQKVITTSKFKSTACEVWLASGDKTLLDVARFCCNSELVPFTPVEPQKLYAVLQGLV